MIDKKARSFVMIMMAIAVSALAVRVLIHRLVGANIAQNESYALVTIKLISAALENYARDNQGVYPTDFSLLLKAQPPYLDKDYLTQSPLKGYNYTCVRLEPSGYSCSAGPSRYKLSGNASYTITTGGSLISQRDQERD